MLNIILILHLLTNLIDATYVLNAHFHTISLSFIYWHEQILVLFLIQKVPRDNRYTGILLVNLFPIRQIVQNRRYLIDMYVLPGRFLHLQSLLTHVSDDGYCELIAS